jgi:hypothetical protein
MTLITVMFSDRPAMPGRSRQLSRRISSIFTPAVEAR